MLGDGLPRELKIWKPASLDGFFDQAKAIELSFWLAGARGGRGGRSHLRSSWNTRTWGGAQVTRRDEFPFRADKHDLSGILKIPKSSEQSFL